MSLRTIKRLRRDDEGAALVEFGMILPFILLLFAVTIEGSRMMWSYQATIAGVRDATRYIARVVQIDACASGEDLSGWSDTLTDIVRNTSTDHTLFPASISVTAVDATLTCVTGNYRMITTPLVTVTAQLEITYPFEDVFALSGITFGTSNTVVSDTSRVFGV